MVKSILLTVLSLVIILSVIVSITFGVLVYRLSQPIEEEAFPDWSPEGQRITYECYIDWTFDKLGRRRLKKTSKFGQNDRLASSQSRWE